MRPIKERESDSLLSFEVQAKIKALYEERAKVDNKVDPNLYAKLSARIRYLRVGPSAYNAWRIANHERITQLRRSRKAYYSARKPVVLTDEQRIKRNEATYRSDQRNPQRAHRRNIERILHVCYSKWQQGLPFTESLTSEKLWGCTTAQFKAHIDSKLARYGWTWRDKGVKWTMDHFKPISSFNLPDEKLACWHYTNLRPLAKGLNNRRGIWNPNPRSHLTLNAQINGTHSSSESLQAR